MKKLFAIILVSALFLSCQKEPKINGLWEVTKVTAGENEMTPNARWMRFNADSTQQSGNGYFQHSYGTWKYDKTKNELKILNVNNLLDQNPAFSVDLKDSTMTWTRIEEGQNVTVYLKKIKKLPSTFGDDVLGLWKPETIKGNGDFFTETSNPTDYLFFRWDKKFVVNNSKGKFYGVYNVHGHKAELELIPYDDSQKRSFWKIDYEKTDKIQLTLLNSDSLVQRTFKRINQYPK